MLIVSVLAFALSALLRPNLTDHGLRAVYNPGGLNRVESVILLTSNDRTVHPNESLSVKWMGYLYQPSAAEVHFRVPAGVQARLVINESVVFDTSAQHATNDSAVAHPGGGFNTLAYEVSIIPTQRQYFQTGLEWQTPFGWQLVPTTYLYPEFDDETSAQQAIRRAQWSQALAGCGVALGLLSAALWLWQQRHIFQSRTALGLALIVLLALALRLLFLRDYAAQPAADVLGYGSDHRGYQDAALDFLRGQWPPAQAFYVQPGMNLFLGGVYSLFGPDIRLVQIIQMTLGAFTSILVFDFARRTFDDATGWAAALLWAIFPLPIFYEAQLLTHGLEPTAGATLLFLWLRSLDPAPRQGIWIVTLGLALGAASVLRPTFLILAPFIALTFFFKHRPNWRAMIGWPLALAILTLLPILPITWHNYKASGRFQLLTSNSDITLYLGNNRDSTGLGEYSPAYLATHTLVNQGKTTYFRQTLDDIRHDPLRWVQLMTRKTALYLGDPELPNNVDFYAEGTAISPLLAALPLRFGAMMALALAGVVLAWPHRNGTLLLLIYILSQVAVTIVYHVFSRFRAPIYPVLVIASAYAITFTLSSLRQKQWRPLSIRLATLAASGLFVAAMPTAAESIMSRPVVASLPSTAKPLDIPIGDSLTLLGYEPLPVVAPGDPFFITLYWQSNKPIPTDLYATVQLFGGDLKVAQADQPIGAGSFPDYPTRQWQPGQIIRDTHFIQMPDTAPAPLALALLVAAYERDTGNRLGETTFGYVPLTRREPLTVPPGAQLVNATISTATLMAYAIHDQTLTLFWQAGEPMSEDGIVFVHLFDSNGNFVTGTDSRPVNNLYSTLVWQQGEGIVDDHALPPALPSGTYTIKIGMYDAASQNRIPVVNADGETMPDGVLTLGAITFP